uniref:F-box domain-containing protein n=1 Tax=Chrysotila carterae TaxID=13221 RepID=A0A7S4EUY0_CHRCT
MEASAIFFVRMPAELLPDLLRTLDLCSLLALRGCCRSLRALTAQPELWLALTQHAYRHLRPASSIQALQHAVPTHSQIFPLALHRASSLVDVRARLVRWPSRLKFSELHGASGGRRQTVSVIGGVVPSERLRLSPDGLEFQHVGTMAMESHGLQFARSDAPFPSVEFPCKRDPLPFATSAAEAGGRSDGWALRMAAYFEAVLVRDEQHDLVGLAIGLATEAFPLVQGMFGEHDGAVVLLTRSGFLCQAGRSAELIRRPTEGVRRSVETGEHHEGGFARPGDVVGVGLDYKKGCAFWTLNGVLCAQREIDLRLSHYAVLGAMAGCDARVAFNAQQSTLNAQQSADSKGNGFLFDVLAYEEEMWSEWQSEHAMQTLFEACQQTKKEAQAREGSGESARVSGSRGDGCSERRGDGDDGVDDGCCDGRRGWPWCERSSKWQHAVDAHVRPWLDAAASTETRALMPPRARETRLHLAVAPALLPLWPHADALSVTAADVDELCQFLINSDNATAAVDAAIAAAATVATTAVPAANATTDPSAVTATTTTVSSAAASSAATAATALAAQGLTLRHLRERPLKEVMAIARRARLAVGLRQRLKLAICSELGTDLSRAASQSVSAISSVRPASRVFQLRRSVEMVVLLSPWLPVRATPSLCARIVGMRCPGDVVVVTSVCDGWLELRGGAFNHASGGGRAHGGLWVLYDGRIVRHAAPLLRTLLAQDECEHGRCAHFPRPSCLDLDRMLDEIQLLEQEDEEWNRANGVHLLCPEHAAWSTTREGGQQLRRRELCMLLQTGGIAQTPFVARLLATGTSCDELCRLSSTEVRELARRVEMPVGLGLRFVRAVQVYLQSCQAASGKRSK